MLRTVRTQLVKWTAEGAVKSRKAQYSATCGHTLVAGNMLVFRKEREESVHHGMGREARWHRG